MAKVTATLVTRKAETTVPPIVSWIVTGRCNMRCLHCYPNSGPDFQEPELDFQGQAQAVGRLAAAGVETLFLSGGEVLLLPRLFDLVDLIHSQGMGSWICTNGSLMDPGMADRIAASGIRGVSVSLDSSDPAIHDAFRCHPGAHGKALEAIRLLRERDVTVNVDYTATRANRQGLGDLLSLVSPYGVKSVFLKRFRPLGRGGQNAERLALTLAEYRESVQRLIGSYPGSGTEVCFEDPAVYAYCLKAGVGGVRLDGLYGRFGCLAGVVWLGLQPNGDITPCPLLNLPVGNIQREDLATALARSPVMARLLDRNDRDGKCGTCEDRWRCGGCRAHAHAASGDPFAEDPFCLRALAVD